MQIKYLFREVSVDEDKKAYIEQKLESVERIIGRDDVLFEVEVNSCKNNQFRVEVNVSYPKNMYRAENTSESIEASIDLVEEELKVQARKKKEKQATLARRGGRSIKKKLTLDEGSRF